MLFYKEGKCGCFVLRNKWQSWVQSTLCAIWVQRLYLCLWINSSLLGNWRLRTTIKSQGVALPIWRLIFDVQIQPWIVAKSLPMSKPQYRGDWSAAINFDLFQRFILNTRVLIERPKSTRNTKASMICRDPRPHKGAGKDPLSWDTRHKNGFLYIFLKMGHPQPLFLYFWPFQTNKIIFTTNQREKYPSVPGFEPTTSWTRVVSHNH